MDSVNHPFCCGIDCFSFFDSKPNIQRFHDLYDPLEEDHVLFEDSVENHRINMFTFSTNEAYYQEWIENFEFFPPGTVHFYTWSRGDREVTVVFVDCYVFHNYLER
ncbi:MAG: hypothetical protein ACRDBG_25155 [Waterburya sp.]